MGEWEKRGSGGRVREWGKGREKRRGEEGRRGGEGNGDVGRKGDGRWGMRDVGRGSRMGIGKGFGNRAEVETQVDGRVSRMGVLGLKVFPSSSMDASNDGLCMVGTPDSA